MCAESQFIIMSWRLNYLRIILYLLYFAEQEKGLESHKIQRNIDSLEDNVKRECL